MPIALWSEDAVTLMEDLSPDVGFGSEIDDACNEIEKATTGFGANAKKTIDSLATFNATDRSKIYRRYQELHGQDLAELMVKEFSGKIRNTDLGLCMEFLAYPPDMAECAMLYRAMKGVGASVNIIYSVLCGRTNYEMERIKVRRLCSLEERSLVFFVRLRSVHNLLENVFQNVHARLEQTTGQ